MNTEDELKEHEKRIAALENCVDSLDKAIARIEGSMSSIELIVKWVIVPLLIILGGLVGIKIALP